MAASIRSSVRRGAPRPTAPSLKSQEAIEAARRRLALARSGVAAPLEEAVVVPRETQLDRIEKNQVEVMQRFAAMESMMSRIYQRAYADPNEEEAPADGEPEPLPAAEDLDASEL